MKVDEMCQEREEVVAVAAEAAEDRAVVEEASPQANVVKM